MAGERLADDEGQVLVIFYQKNISWSFAMVENTAQFGKEKIFIERLLDPSLGISRKLRPEC